MTHQNVWTSSIHLLLRKSIKLLLTYLHRQHYWLTSLGPNWVMILLNLSKDQFRPMKHIHNLLQHLIYFTLKKIAHTLRVPFHEKFKSYMFKSNPFLSATFVIPYFFNWQLQAKLLFGWCNSFVTNYLHNYWFTRISPRFTIQHVRSFKVKNMTGHFSH